MVLKFRFALKFQFVIKFKTCLDVVLGFVMHDELILGSVCVCDFCCSGDPFGFWVVLWVPFSVECLKKFSILLFA